MTLERMAMSLDGPINRRWYKKWYPITACVKFGYWNSEKDRFEPITEWHERKFWRYSKCEDWLDVVCDLWEQQGIIALDKF